jgi:hypothetical protein
MKCELALREYSGSCLSLTFLTLKVYFRATLSLHNIKRVLHLDLSVFLCRAEKLEIIRKETRV